MFNSGKIVVSLLMSCPKCGFADTNMINDILLLSLEEIFNSLAQLYSGLH